MDLSSGPRVTYHIDSRRPIMMIGGMTEKRPADSVIAFRPRASDMERLVRELAMDSDNVRWRSSEYKTHADQRSSDRDITDVMMFEVLRRGYIKGDIEAGRNPGEWKVKMCKQMKGRREVGVVTVVINNKRLFVKTVEWEDLR